LRSKTRFNLPLPQVYTALRREREPSRPLLGSAAKGLFDLKGTLRVVMRKKSTKSGVDQYIAGVPEPARRTLKKVRAAIRAAAPREATETISYRIPTFKYKGSLVAFASFTNHCSFFPMSMAVMRKFKKDLKNYDSSKGTIRFPVDKPMSAALVKKLVKARVAQNEQRTRN